MLTRAIFVVMSHSCAYGCRITAVAAGLNHTVALTVAGDIFMTGHNKHGALGLGDTINRFLPTKVNPTHLTFTHLEAHCVEPPCLLCLGGAEHHLVGASPLNAHVVRSGGSVADCGDERQGGLGGSARHAGGQGHSGGLRRHAHPGARQDGGPDHCLRCRSATSGIRQYSSMCYIRPLEDIVTSHVNVSLHQ